MCKLSQSVLCVGMALGVSGGAYAKAVLLFFIGI
jgi:hypothetical protein